LKNLKPVSLARLGIEESGNDCDPVSRECFAGFENGVNLSDAIEPVCNQAVEVDRTNDVNESAGTKYHFSPAGCPREFEQSPAHFSGRAA
jgi:YHS domain-containing protein